MFLVLLWSYMNLFEYGSPICKILKFMTYSSYAQSLSCVKILLLRLLIDWLKPQYSWSFIYKKLHNQPVSLFLHELYRKFM